MSFSSDGEMLKGLTCSMVAMGAVPSWDIRALMSLTMLHWLSTLSLASSTADSADSSWLRRLSLVSCNCSKDLPKFAQMDSAEVS